MARTPKEPDQQQGEPDLAPDAWDRFERAVDVVAKSKPRPKTKAADKRAGEKDYGTAEPTRRHRRKKP